MTEMTDLIRRLSGKRLDALRQLLDEVAPRLAEAANLLLHACLQGHRVYLCPQRETQQLSERLAGLLLSGVAEPRPGLPVVLLRPLPGEGPSCTQQIGSLASPGDVMVALTGGRLTGLEAQIDSARQHDMRLILLGSPPIGALSSKLQEDDLLIQFDTACPLTLHEASLAAVHALCEALDHRLLGRI